MRTEPTWRIPAGILTLTVVLTVYGFAIAHFISPLISGWPALGQLPVYIVLGLVWLLPLRRFLIWMETGNWGEPPDLGE